MANILSGAAVVFDYAIQNVGTVANTITAQPLLMLFVVGMPLCGIAIGFLKRLISC